MRAGAPRHPTGSTAALIEVNAEDTPLSFPAGDLLGNDAAGPTNESHGLFGSVVVGG